VEVVQHKTTNRAATVQKPAALLKRVQRQAVAGRGSLQLQSSLKVSSPKDPAEKEADVTAQKIMRMAVSESSISYVGNERGGVFRQVKQEEKEKKVQTKLQSPYITRFANSGIFTQQQPGETVQSKGEGQPNVTSTVAADIQTSTAAGLPLPLSVRRFMEPRFQSDFSNVKIHTGDKSAKLNRQLNAQAFTTGNHIFFGKDKFQPDRFEGKELIAHELTHTVQQGAAIQRRENPGTTNLLQRASEGDKRMYRTSDGKLVELPPDITEAEAAKLETEAKAAEKKLGKGPPPKPVPDVKKLAKKEGKKERIKLLAKDKKAGKVTGKATPKAGVTAAGMLKAVGSRKVAQYLAAKGTPVLLKGMGRLHQLKQNEQTHDNALEKLQQSENAVVIPPSEGQSKSNTGQVNTVSENPTPVADENKGKQKLQESLKANIPQSIEDVDNFKRDQKAQHIGADVMMVVQGDKNAVVSTFSDMETTPPPTPPEQPPEALPPEEIAPPTATMNLGQGAIAPLQKEHTDLSNFTKEADSKLTEEGVTQEQLDMVDSGDLAEANKEKKGMQKAATTEPLAVQKFAQQEAGKVDQDLKQQEKQQRDGLKAKRKANLGTTAQKQKGTKSALEKKREEVAAKINEIYTKAQNSVKKKLADLETQSMKRFDDGNAKATKEFEDNVNRQIDAFKDDRYSGFFGWARKAKDWLLGMDDLPEVKAIFDRNRATFVSTIDKLVGDISADNKRVIQECKEELNNAKVAIKEYVDKLGPDLKDIGKKAAEEMNSKLNELDQFINKKEEELQQKLADKQTAAIKAIDEKIEKMKEAMSGALAKLGKLLLLAAKKFFTWALEKAGFSLGDIEGIINKGAAVLKAIFTKPIQFVKNLINAAINGFKNFGKNFLKHLKNALFEWLTGSLEGLVLPQTWDFKGIISVALQMIGISYQNIRKHMVTVMDEDTVVRLEKTFTLVKTLITEGPMAAWEQLKEMASEMQEAFIEAVKDFIKIKIIEQAIQWVVSIFVPGAGIVKAIVGIYDTIVFFIQKAKQIMQMIGNFLGSMGEIAAGNIGAAADALESGLARGLTLVISFLAQLLRLSGITNKIKDAIGKIRDKVDAVLLKVAKWIAEKAKKVGTAVLQAGVPQDPVQRLRLGMGAAVAAVNRFAGRRVGAAILNPLLAAVRARYGFRTLTISSERNRWAVEGEINPRVREVTEALNESAPAGALGFRITGIGSVISQPVAQTQGGRLAPPPTEKFRRAYVGNTPVTLAGSPSAIAQRYRTAFPNVGRVVPEEAEKRFSLVIGVNAIDDLDNQNRAAVSGKVQTGAGVAYPWAVIGFLWRPAWKDGSGIPVADVEIVRRALRGSQVTDQDRAAARETERASINSANIPYGAIRTLILQSSQTATFTSALQARADAVFVHVSDPDTVSFNPSGDDGGIPEALFQRFDRILDGILANVQQHAGRGPRASDGGPPIVATGGYEFQFQLDPSQSVTGQTQDLRVRLSARLDMAVRQAMASVDPGSVYFPEPNLLIQVTPETIQASFGTGRLESRRLLENIRRLGVRPRLIFDTSATLVTSAERFGIEGSRVMTSWGQLRDLTEADLRAMITGSQSHAHQRNWARQVAAAYGLAPPALAPLNRLWEVFFPVSSLLCGFDPVRLREGVTGRQFTSLSSYGQTKEIRASLIEALTSPKRTAEENTALAERLISLARAAGIGLADALIAIFQRSSAG
jgi:hypothetical protein